MGILKYLKEKYRAIEMRLMTNKERKKLMAKKINIKHIRSLFGMTQKQLSKYLGCSQAKISNVENNKSGVKLNTQEMDKLYILIEDIEIYFG